MLSQIEILQDLTNQVADAMGEGKIVVFADDEFMDMFNIDVEGSEDSYAFTLFMEEIMENLPIHFDFIAFNIDRIFTLPIEKIVEIIRHEIMHIVTRLDDNSIIFQNFCKMSNIPLSGSL